MPTLLAAFLAKWSASGAAERANKDMFLTELCDVLGVPRPNPATGDEALDRYVFERGVRFAAEGEAAAHGRIDLYKEGCFLLEAKQGGAAGSKKVGTAKRGTPAWNIAMNDAFGQALGYAKTFDKPPPFLIVCDLGHCFDLYAAFDGTTAYRAYPTAFTHRLFLGDLGKHCDLLRQVMLDPLALDPSKQSAKITREVAGHLADLARTLEKAGRAPDAVATFLMRCLFTMFAEDVDLLPEKIFTKTIKERWLPVPSSFPGGIEHLWRSMNEGVEFGFVGKLLRFNGGLFAQPTAIPLDTAGLELLLKAAECNWAEVDPAIFGTLLERALDPKERHRLGAHYTPRAYVERLVRPTIEEPIRADWDLVRAEVRQLVASATGEKVSLSVEEGSKLSPAELKKLEKLNKKAQGAKKDALSEARDKVRAFHWKLCETKVLDPACGTGNFLYVTLAFFRTLEDEVLALLLALGEPQEMLRGDRHRVTPAQFLGIEVKRWAKEIAELVIWIGYLQAHFKTYGRTMPVPEPVLRDYKNIENRDAVLAWDKVELVRDEKGKPVSRWDGETTKKSPVTGEDIPDEAARMPEYAYVNPRKAEWPKADFIVGNPPFIGNKRMRLALGDGYVDELRRAYNDVPETADYVMYWWRCSAKLLSSGAIRRFGLITTNSISQTFSRKVVQDFLDGPPQGSLAFAISDHPWVDSETAAAVRIAMTVGTAGAVEGVLAHVGQEMPRGDEAQAVLKLGIGRVNADLTIGVDSSKVAFLKSNARLSFMGVTLIGDGFRLSSAQMNELRIGMSELPVVVRPYVMGRDLAQVSARRHIIDFWGLSETEALSRYPDLYQILFVFVKPERDQNPRKTYRDRWWVLGEPREGLRLATANLSRYVVTARTARHRIFQFVDGAALVDSNVVAVTSADSFLLGCLSSRVHLSWARKVGATLEDRPHYTSSTIFETFPFPATTEEQTTRIRALGETLDAHRKRQQAAHPDLTITSMYNVLEKLRSGDPLTDKEKIIHAHGLVSVLKQIHDDLDAAVFAAYGWPADLTDEQILEKLVALNAERAEEERNGHIRWLRPDFQNPAGARAATQEALVDTEPGADDAEPVPAAPSARPWPKKMAEQIAQTREIVMASPRAWSAEDVAQAFTRAPRADVEQVLESFAALGLLLRYDTPQGPRWKVPGKQTG